MFLQILLKARSERQLPEVTVLPMKERRLSTTAVTAGIIVLFRWVLWTGTTASVWEEAVHLKDLILMLRAEV